MNGNAHRSVLLVRIVLGLIPLAAGLYVIGIGQDTNWDLRNYHFYNPFAYLTGRMGHDVAVSHVATYYNPLLYIPFYHAVTALPPKAVGFLLGLIPGFNILFLYAIARRVIDLGRPAQTAWFCLAVALLGLLGQNSFAEVGTSYADNIMSLPVLAAVWLIVRFRDRLAAPGVAGWAVVAAAGLLSGAVFGLKQPFAIYCVGLCAALFGLALPLRRRFLLAFVFGLAVLAGAALTGGFWMLEMWERFGNPLFPYFNEIFKSPWGAEGSYRDVRFIPKSLHVWLLFPIWFNIDPMQVGEVPFRDLRFGLIYVLLIVLLVRAVWRLLKKPTTDGTLAPAQTDRRSVTRFFVIFTAVSFAVWMKLFGVYRYIIVAEFLAPLVIFLLIAALVANPQRCLRLTAAAFVLLLVTSRARRLGAQALDRRLLRLRGARALRAPEHHRGRHRPRPDGLHDPVFPARGALPAHPGLYDRPLADAEPDRPPHAGGHRPTHGAALHHLPSVRGVVGPECPRGLRVADGPRKLPGDEPFDRAAAGAPVLFLSRHQEAVEGNPHEIRRPELSRGGDPALLQ